MTLTVAEREDILNTISDLTKDAYGFRVRYIDWNSMSDDELLADYNRWLERAQESARREEEMENLNYRNWLSHIEEVMAVGASTKATAILWDMQSMGVDKTDVGYYCYLHGIGYSHESEIETILKGYRYGT